MRELIIEDVIVDSKVLLTSDSISNGFVTIDFNDITNFKFEHGYYTINGITRGGIDFRIYSKTNTIRYIVNAGTFNSRRISEENIRRISVLFERIMPTLMISFIKHAIAVIDKKGAHKVCKMKFKKDGIYMRQRVYYWLKEVFVPYNFAEIEGDTAKWGRFYSGGTANLLRLKNRKTKESYKYSRKIDFQPNSIEIYKAQELLRHIVNNELFENKTIDNSKRL